MNDLGNVIAIIISLLSTGIFAIAAFVIWLIFRHFTGKTLSYKRQLNDPNQAQSFQVPNRPKLTWTLAAVIFFTLGTFLFSTPFIITLTPFNSTEEMISSKLDWTWGLPFLVIAAWCVQIIWGMGYSVTIDDDSGIYSGPPNRLNNRINWPEVGKIQDQRLFGSLKIMSRDGGKIVRVAYQLEDFDYLLTYVLKKVMASGQTVELPKTFKNRGYQVTITELECKIHNQPEVQIIQFKSISSVNIGKEFENNIFNYLRIWFVTDTGDSIRLKTSGNEVELFQALYYAWSSVHHPMSTSLLRPGQNPKPVTI